MAPPFDCSARYGSLDLMDRSARGDVRRVAAAFVECDGTTISGESAPLATRFVGSF
jgi:hypothetical protein